MLFQHTTDNFIGRNKEIVLFEQWLNTMTAPYILYFYDALDEEEKKGGIGKTWLLRRCATLARQKNPAMAIVMIDFFNVADRDGKTTTVSNVEEVNHDNCHRGIFLPCQRAHSALTAMSSRYHLLFFFIKGVIEVKNIWGSGGCLTTARKALFLCCVR